MASSAPITVTNPETDTDTMHDIPWRVIVFNDPVNLMDYVVYVFKRVFNHSDEDARKHMLEVHQLGRSLVWCGGREKAEHYVHILQQWQLSATLEKDAQE